MTVSIFSSTSFFDLPLVTPCDERVGRVGEFRVKAAPQSSRFVGRRPPLERGGGSANGDEWLAGGMHDTYALLLKDCDGFGD